MGERTADSHLIAFAGHLTECRRCRTALLAGTDCTVDLRERLCRWGLNQVKVVDRARRRERRERAQKKRERKTS